MRRTLCVIALLSATVCGSAFADPWTDQASGLSFTTPAGWSAVQAPSTSVTYVRTQGTADAGTQECHFLAKPRPETADASPYRTRVAGREPVAESVWAGMTTAIRPVFNGIDARFAEARLDETQFWPIQF